MYLFRPLSRVEVLLNLSNYGGKLIEVEKLARIIFVMDSRLKKKARQGIGE